MTSCITSFANHSGCFVWNRWSPIQFIQYISNTTELTRKQDQKSSEVNSSRLDVLVILDSDWWSKFFWSWPSISIVCHQTLVGLTTVSIKLCQVSTWVPIILYAKDIYFCEWIELCKNCLWIWMFSSSNHNSIFNGENLINFLIKGSRNSIPLNIWQQAHWSNSPLQINGLSNAWYFISWPSPFKLWMLP